MVNIHQLVLEIIARWSKKLLHLTLLLLLFSSQGYSQDQDPLSKKERREFNEVFFEAEKQKNLGNIEEARVLYERLFELDVENATVCYELARIYASQENKEEAIYYAEKATRLNPANQWFQYLLAQVYGGFNMPDLQIEVLRKLVDLDTANPDYRYELAMAYLRNQQPREALLQLDELEEDLGINEVISDQKKSIYLELGELENAAIEIERLIETYPRNLDYYGSLAQLYRANGLDAEAFVIYQKMLDLDPEDPRVHLDLAQYYRDNGNVEKSIFHLRKAVTSPLLSIDQKVPVLMSLFDASEKDSLLGKESYIMLESLVENHPEDPKAYAIYGDFLSRDGHNEQALKAYKKAVQLDGGSRFQIWEQILLIEIQGEQYDSLLVDAPRVIELFPNQPLPYLLAGVASLYAEQAFEAVGYLEDGLSYVLGNSGMKEQFYTQLASAYHELGEHEKSDTYFEKALVINRDNPTLLNNYAYYLAERNEKLDRALEMTRRSNSLAPNNPIFLDTWAWVLFKLEKYSEALEKIESALQLITTESGEILEHYGDILHRNERSSEALEQWKKARDAGGASDEIDQKIKNMGSVE